MAVNQQPASVGPPGAFEVFRVPSSIGEGYMLLGYRDEGRSMLHAKLDSKIANKLARIQIQVKDLEYCEAAVKLALPRVERRLTDRPHVPFNIVDEEDIFLRSLFISSVVTYGRLFTGGGRSLNESHVFKGQGARFLPFHYWIRDTVRNGYIAHAGDCDLEQAATYVVFSMEDGLPPKLSVDPHATFVSSLYPQDFRKFSMLIDHLKQLLVKQNEVLSTKLMNEEIVPGEQEIAPRGTLVRLERLAAPGPPIDPIPVTQPAPGSLPPRDAPGSES